MESVITLTLQNPHSHIGESSGHHNLDINNGQQGSLRDTFMTVSHTCSAVCSQKINVFSAYHGWVLDHFGVHFLAV